jgi:hypothetical protein
MALENGIYLSDEQKISNLTDSVVILLNKTTDYFNPSPNTAATNAQVSISDNAGNVYPLTEVASGVYYNGHIAGIPRTTYTLKIDDGVRDVINNDGLFSSSTPANPTGNISNGALGYFAAWSVSVKTMVVP